MSKKLIIAVLIASALTVGFVLLAIGAIGPETAPSRKQQLQELTFTNTIPKTASLYFSPPTLTLNPRNNQPTVVNVIVDSGGSLISGAQLELKYDPSVLSNVQITSPENSFFGSSVERMDLFNEVDQANGRISFAVAVKQKAQARQGSGSVATISFTVNPNAESTSTKLSFQPTTLVTKMGERQTILREAAGLMLLFNTNLGFAQ